jgi:hypothetical protein
MTKSLVPGVGMSRASAVTNGARGTWGRSGRGGLPGRSRSAAQRRRSVRVSAAALIALLASACAATQLPAVTEAGAPGFLLGVWHGFIFPVAFIVSLFTDSVAIYAVPNNGGWYDFGFFVGIVFIGVGARGSRVVYRDRIVRVRD